MPTAYSDSLEARFFAFLSARYPPSAIVTLSAFALSGIGYGSALLGALPSLEALVVAAAVLVGLSFQLAVADALRDQSHAEGVWREPIAKAPLLVIATGMGVVQFVLTMALHPPLLGALATSWLVIGLASQDFFLPGLRQRPALSVGLHLIGLASAGYYVAGAEIFRLTGEAHPGLIGFTALTVTSGLALEIVRKCEAPLDERDAVQTYSRAWGPSQAGMAVSAVVISALLAGTVAYLGLGAFPGLMIPAVLLAAAAFIAAARFALGPSRVRVDQMRLTVTLFVVASFLTLGLAPLFLRTLGL